MRVVFSSLPAYGHAYPLIPLALASRDAGHDVLFATGESFHPNLKLFGLDVVDAGVDVVQAFAEANGGERLKPADLTPQRQKEMASAVLGDALPRAFVRDLGPVLERVRPDVVVYGAGNPGALVAARLAGIPGICQGFGLETSSPMSSAIVNRLTTFAAEVGVELAPVGGGGDPYLDIYPESLQGKEFLAKVNRTPLRPVPVNEPGELPASVLSRDRGRPLAYLTLGTAFGAIPVLKQAIAGLAGLDVDVLVAAGPSIDARALGDLPDNVEVRAWVPQADLLSHVDLVVHHGGSGTTLGALANGLPQLVLPQGADQFDNAEAVVTAGAGAQLFGDDQSAEPVAETAKRLLVDDGVRAAARAIAAEIAEMPAPEDIAPRLAELASRA
ncbi:glycosyltransferase [Amycolatopsis taiwanensis]|uniref:Glycosyl transferase n=1 Tax=Amycolatopsis taiwanensis TaxID=342230 RepID=A0A9W6R6J6_9PSEU|nr:glycosyltransferase [Amycolatopsis taiwanensis]GLY68472.1 glycosyl transferase [Amycolatopsis taiwanensis]